MATSGEAPRPVSLWVAVIGSALEAGVVLAFAIGSIASNHALFSWGVGAMLVGYALLIAAGSWLGWRKHLLARGLIVAPALLNIIIAISLITAGDVPQSIGAALAIAILLTTVVAAVLPSTHRALDPRVART